MSQAARAATLAKIREALGGYRDTPTEQGQELAAASPPEAAELCACFLRELNLLGARGIVIDTWEEVARWTQHLLSESGSGSICLGPGAKVQALRDLLAAPGQAAFSYVETQAPPALAAQAQAGIVQAEMAIAATGSLVLDTAQGLLASLLPPFLIALVPAETIVADVASAIRRLASTGRGGGRVTVVTGPSRTADIEKKLVLGVHGPRDLAVLVLKSRGPEA